jgi:hypothetical protein
LTRSRSQAPAGVSSCTQQRSSSAVAAARPC